MTDIGELRRLAGRDSLLAALPEEGARKVVRWKAAQFAAKRCSRGMRAMRLILTGAVKISVVSAGRDRFAYLSVGDQGASVLDERPRGERDGGQAVNTLVIMGADLQRLIAVRLSFRAR
jgi:hypothetical protein